jgi:hypothetical protein
MCCKLHGSHFAVNAGGLREITTSWNKNRKIGMQDIDCGLENSRSFGEVSMPMKSEKRVKLSMGGKDGDGVASRLAPPGASGDSYNKVIPKTCRKGFWGLSCLSV